jgi:23S rRNA (cytosine1962-C5)-methyltransferase
MSNLPILKLRPGRDKNIHSRHHWLFSGALAQIPKDIADGILVELRNEGNTFLATGMYSPHSIAVRILSFEPGAIDRDFWKKKLEACYNYRLSMGLPNEKTDMYRLVHAEGDTLPGLIIDIYGRTAVIQSHTLGIDQFVPTIAELLVEMKIAESVVFRSGLMDKKPEILKGKAKAVEAIEDGLRYKVDVLGGQKTGFFLDQRENRELVKALSEGKSVLNLFSFNGGFTLQALQGGAQKVISVDVSASAIAQLEENLALNFKKAPHKSHVQDVFEFLENNNEQFDLVICDPPAFAKKQSVLSQALKGYRRLNYAVMNAVKPGGLLFTFSCSQVVSKQDFRKVIFEAASSKQRHMRIVHELGHPADHPINVFHPESEYLKGLVLHLE